MRKLPLLLATLLVVSSSAYAKTPAEREQIMHDSVGMHHHVNRELRQEIRADKKELRGDRKEMRRDKRELRKDKRALRRAQRHHHNNNK